LRVEFAGLDFHAFVTKDCGSAGLLDPGFGCKMGMRHVPALVLVGLGELDLNSVDAIDAVNEKDQDEDKSYLHPIL
jgi:hypothetical protein